MTTFKTKTKDGARTSGINEKFVGCGGACACAQEKGQDSACATPSETVSIDKFGKCPCGKSKEDCCHKDTIDENAALHELCEPHNGKHVCDTDTDLEKTAA